jgi:hypothetical protein
MPGEDPRPEFDPDWPVCDQSGCWGVQHNGPRCVAHGGGLDGFAPGAELDLRGVAVDSALLATILGKFRDHKAKRFVFGRVLCDHTWFNGKAWFDGSLFTGETSFDNACFSALAFFDGAACEEDLSFVATRFAGSTQMNSMRATWIDMDGAWFAEAVAIDVGATELICTNTRFDGGVSLLAGYAVDMTGARFGAPSTVVGAIVTSLANCDVSNLALSEVDLSGCTFLGAHRLEQLRIDGSTRFAVPEKRWGTRRWVLADEAAGPPARVAATYRALRKSLEDSKNEAGAGDFYYGEMTARRRTTQSSRAERAILTVYWVLSGYGQRAWRALAALLVVIVAVTTVLVVAGQDFGLAARVALGTALSKDPQVELTATGEWVVLVARFLGPVLLALAVLAVRARVKR